MTDISAAIGKRIRTFRNAQGISLEELSFKADLNAAHLGQIERGLRKGEIPAQTVYAAWGRQAGTGCTKLWRNYTG